MADGLMEWMPLIAYILLALPVIGYATVTNWMLVSPVTLGVVVGIVGILAHFGVFKKFM